MAKMSRYEKAINRLDYAYKASQGKDPNAGFTGSGGGGRGNPYHLPGGSPQGGQFTHGPVAKVNSAMEHVSAKGHGVADTRQNKKAPSDLGAEWDGNATGPTGGTTAKSTTSIPKSPDDFMEDPRKVWSGGKVRQPTNNLTDSKGNKLLWPKGMAGPTGNLNGRRLRGH